MGFPRSDENFPTISKLDLPLRSRQITFMSNKNFADLLIEAARELSVKVDRLKFNRPVTHVYNPLNYAWAAHEEFLRRFGNSAKKIIFLGMNPGPFGMVQTGIPFGEISAVRDWLRITAKIGSPLKQHTKRPIFGYECERSEVSGQRLWGLFQKRFVSPQKFFRQHFVVNYCPLAFLEESGCNRTPDKLPKAEAARLFKICDEHLNRVVEILKPEWLIGIGGFALARATLAGEKNSVRVGQILHPSPASPAANRGWADAATKQLVELGVWKSV
jgi:single-strand selective monofunctional uracil DNA glycosylase